MNDPFDSEEMTVGLIFVFPALFLAAMIFFYYLFVVAWDLVVHRFSGGVAIGNGFFHDLSLGILYLIIGSIAGGLAAAISEGVKTENFPTALKSLLGLCQGPVAGVAFWFIGMKALGWLFPSSWLSIACWTIGIIGGLVAAVEPVVKDFSAARDTARHHAYEQKQQKTRKSAADYIDRLS